MLKFFSYIVCLAKSYNFILHDYDRKHIIINNYLHNNHDRSFNYYLLPIHYRLLWISLYTIDMLAKLQLIFGRVKIKFHYLVNESLLCHVQNHAYNPPIYNIDQTFKCAQIYRFLLIFLAIHLIQMYLI
jgi:hypothetical protein